MRFVNSVRDKAAPSSAVFALSAREHAAEPKAASTNKVSSLPDEPFNISYPLSSNYQR
jgi:hypothetical protein